LRVADEPGAHWDPGWAARATLTWMRLVGASKVAAARKQSPAWRAARAERWAAAAEVRFEGSLGYRHVSGQQYTWRAEEEAAAAMGVTSGAAAIIARRQRDTQARRRHAEHARRQQQPNTQRAPSQQQQRRQQLQQRQQPLQDSVAAQPSALSASQQRQHVTSEDRSQCGAEQRHPGAPANALAQPQDAAHFSGDASADEGSPDGAVPTARRTRRSDAVLAFTAPAYAQLERHLRRHTQLLGRYRHAKRARGDG